MLKSKLVTYSVITTFLLNMNAVTVSAALTGASLLFNKAWAQTTESQTPLLDQLREKYDLDNPDRNHRDTGHVPESVLRQMNPNSKDLTDEMVRQLSTSSPSRTITLPTAPTSEQQRLSQQNARGMALNVGKTHLSPTQNAEGGVNAEYARGATREFYRDENGALKMRVVEGVERVSGLSDADLYSNELQSEEHDFKAAENYGKDNEIYQDGNRNHQVLSQGRSGTARGYQAVTVSARKGINTTVRENEPWLQPSFNSILDTEADPSSVFTSCQEVTKQNVLEVPTGEIQRFFCQDTSKSQMDFCEVERRIVIPAYADTDGVRSCGPGCYEYDMKVDTWKTSRCRATVDGEADPAVFALRLNTDEGFKVKKVTLKGDAADHFRFQLNGQTIWENDRRTQKPIGNFGSGGCNISGHSHAIDTDVTNRVQQIMSNAIGFATMRFVGDLTWKRNGHMFVTIRVELEGINDQLENEYIQYPEGCYDALLEEDKITRGLTGVYNDTPIGVLPDNSQIERYSCTAPARNAVCPAGEFAFGNRGRESCYAEQVPPTCPAGFYNSESDSCEYDAAISCPSIPQQQCGMDGDKPKFSQALTHSRSGSVCTYTDVEHCGSVWSHTEPANYSCPNGGVLSGEKCVISPNKENICKVELGYRPVNIKIEGEDRTLCEGPVKNYTQSDWSCNGTFGFSAAHCSVSREDFMIGEDTYVTTIDDNGFFIPGPYYDEDNELVTFTDSASCTRVIKENESEPDPDLPASFCTFDEYENIDVSPLSFPGDILNRIPQFYDGDDGQKTWKVNLKGYKCDPTLGNILCYYDEALQEEVCVDWDEVRNKPNQCQVYMDDSSCREVSRECTEGWFEEKTGRCMADTVTYECAETRVVRIETEETTNTCSGMIPCIGGDCDFGETESNGRFVEAAVAGSILDNIQSDSSCSDPTDPTTCRIFEGEYKYCSWEVTGLGTDCCESPAGLDILAYVSFSRQMMKLGQMTDSGAFGSAAQGTYKTVSEPINSAGKAIADWSKEAYSKSMNSLFGSETVGENGVTAAAEIGPAALEQLLNQLKQQVYGFVKDMLPEQLGNMLFQGGAAVGGEAAAGDLALNSNITNFMSNVMAAYAAYQMMKLALTLLTACDDVEMDMGVKLAQRMCFEVERPYCSMRVPLVGVCIQRRQDYCCYSSILSRIIMKESYNQLGINPVPVSRPGNDEERSQSCMGLTADQLAQVDFAKPSMQSALQEWIGLMLDSGEIRTTADERSLTGGASKEDLSCQPVTRPKIDPITGRPMKGPDGRTIYEDTGETECFQRATGGQIYNADDRQTVGERTGERMGTAQERVQESKDYTRDAANNLDCSVYPRPPICRFAIDYNDD